MLRWKALPFILLGSIFIVSGCNNNPEQPAPVTPQAQTLVEKNTVDDCGGSTQGSLSQASAALEAGDFNKANCIASNLFNASVSTNPPKPDVKAALVAFLSKFALLTQTPQMTYLMGNTPPLVATDYFGPAGDLDKLGTLINDRWPNATIPDFQGNLATFLKMHADLGHSVNDVFAKFCELISANFHDLHVLQLAMAQDTQLSFTDIAGTHFFQSKWPSGQKFTFTEAGILNFWISALRLGANLAPRYDLGFGEASLSSLPDLMTDMNTAPRLFTLNGSADATDAAPLVTQLLNATILSVRNSVASAPQTWIKDLFPKDSEGQVQLLTLANELEESMQGKMVWLATTKYQFAINVQKLLSQLPTSQGIPGDVVKLTSSGKLDLTETFIANFISGFTEHR